MAHLIDKDILVTETERKADIICQGVLSEEATMSVEYFKDSLISFLDTLEVKEVDLDFMLHEYWGIFPKICVDCLESATMTKDEMIDFAKHFFELGVRVNNPITAADRGTAEEIIINLKRVEQDYHIDLTREIEWLSNKVQKEE